MKVRGSKEFIRNLNLLDKKLVVSNKDGMKASVLAIKAEAQKRTPVDTGYLRSSVRTVVSSEKESFIGEITYLANYAFYVHERVNLRHIVGEAKFLEHALFYMWPRVTKIFTFYASKVLK